MTATVSNMTAIMKTLYPAGAPADLVYKDHPLLAILAKNENFEGENMKIPLKYAGNSGRSADFETAQNNNSNVKTKAFLITRASDYAVARVTNELLMASKSNPGAFIDALKLEMDGAIIKLSQSLAAAIYGTGSGVVARIASTVTLASTTLTLRDPETVAFFEEGDYITLSAANGGGAVRSGRLQIVALNRDTGVLTTNVNIDTGVATATVNDYISIQGDYDAKLVGMRGWVPDSAPTSSPFFGMDRSVDVVRLGGNRGDFSNRPIEEALIQAAKKCNLQGARSDYAFMDYENFANLCTSLGSKVQYIDKVIADISFRGVQVNTGKGIITVLPDVYAPSDRLFLIQSNTWKLNSLGKAPQLFDADGNAYLRVSNADAIELRCFYYAQLSCDAPGWNGNFQIA